MLGVGVGQDKNGQRFLKDGAFGPLEVRFALRNGRFHASRNDKFSSLVRIWRVLLNSSLRFALIRCEDWEQNWE